MPQAQKRSFLSLYGHTLRSPVTRTVSVTPGLCRHRIKGRHISWFPPSLLILHILHEHTTTHSQRTNNVIRQSLRTAILLRRQGSGIPRWVWVHRCPTSRRAINSSSTGSRTVRCARPGTERHAQWTTPWARGAHSPNQECQGPLLVSLLSDYSPDLDCEVPGWIHTDRMYFDYIGRGYRKKITSYS